ncbi:PREDICTED: galactoside 3(4)-L-fucosyltransferase-like [Nanorana parkeri]|uniref:galactoside 3(4)-L-fucosyltransferase-like n=1 Tax=Nanorana parkeri TaxID=125878 RepID=UPI0008545667|nr:PREDICTED: galactoside 3(4)-L-fucosyltransferase-like [Nanorana parkeri]
MSSYVEDKMAKKTHKQLLFFTCFLFVILFLYMRISRQVSSISQDQIKYPSFIEPIHSSRQRRKNNSQLLILVWTWPFRETFPLDTCQSAYRISGCNLTVNRDLLGQADAVILHHYDVMYSRDLPQGPRPHHQRWVWFNIEPPIVVENLNIFDNLINLTMTYREDSDIFLPYGFLKPLKEPHSFKMPTKSRLVAWVVSKWYPGARRNSYYKELKKHIHIDVYGKYHQKLSWDDLDSTLVQYKFYLAFENCEHEDYITEKLWSNSFNMGVVPVVLGATRKNYERFIPSDSFIHVDDFASPKELAEFLMSLDKDNAKYEKYFKWRLKYEVVRETGWDNIHCKACRELQQYEGYKAMPSVATWFLK